MTTTATNEPSGPIGRQGTRFAAIGTVGTLLQLGLYAGTSELIGVQIAAVASWLISTLATNAAHRAVTFGVRGASHNRADQFVAFLTCLVGLLITSLVLTVVPDADGVAGVIAILAVNTVVGAARFLGMRWWLTGSGQRQWNHVTAGLQAVRVSWTSHRTSSGLGH